MKVESLFTDIKCIEGRGEKAERDSVKVSDSADESSQATAERGCQLTVGGLGVSEASRCRTAGMIITIIMTAELEKDSLE